MADGQYLHGAAVDKSEVAYLLYTAITASDRRKGKVYLATDKKVYVIEYTSFGDGEEPTLIVDLGVS